MILDGATVIAGSFNFSKNAEDNHAENLLNLKSCPQMINAYNANFRAHEAHCEAYKFSNHEQLRLP